MENIPKMVKSKSSKIKSYLEMIIMTGKFSIAYLDSKNSIHDSKLVSKLPCAKDKEREDRPTAVDL